MYEVYNRTVHLFSAVTKSSNCTQLLWIILHTHKKDTTHALGNRIWYVCGIIFATLHCTQANQTFCYYQQCQFPDPIPLQVNMAFPDLILTYQRYMYICSSVHVWWQKLQHCAVILNKQ